MERRPQGRRFEDDRLEMVWAALQTLDVGLRYVVLRELATELNSLRLEPRSAQGRVRAAIVSLNHATDFLGEAPTEPAYRALREGRPELRLMPDATVRRLLGNISWQECLRRAFLAAPSDGDFVKRAGAAPFVEEDVLQALRECVHDRGGRIPTFHDYAAWVTDPVVRARPGRRPTSLSVFLRFAGFRACLRSAGFDIDPRQRVDSAGRIVPLRRGYADHELLDAVQARAAELGRTPTSAEYRDLREPNARNVRAGGIADAGPSLTTLVERFGSWSEVVAAAGLAPLEPRPKTRKPAHRRPRYTAAEKLEWVWKAWVAIGSPLTPAAYKSWRQRLLNEGAAQGNELEIPTVDSIEREFGGWRKAREQALPKEPT